MDPLQSYSAFVRSFEAGSFSAVARELGISQSAVSKQIASLEASLGVQLFTRTTRKLQPTTEALNLYDHVRQLLDAVETLRSARGEQSLARGTLRITLPTALGRHRICPRLPDFLRQNPMVDVEALLTDEVLDLVEEGIDLAIRIGTLSPSTLMARPWGLMDQVVVASPKYLAQRRAPESPSDLSEHQCLLYGKSSHWGKWEFESDMGRHVIQVESTLRVNDHEALLNLALEHQGIALIPEWIATAAVSSGSLIPLLEDYYPSPLPINIVYPQTRFLSQRARSFIDFLIEKQPR